VQSYEMLASKIHYAICVENERGYSHGDG
jgi:hypothetical protein